MGGFRQRVSAFLAVDFNPNTFDDVHVDSNACRKVKRNVMWRCAVDGHVVSSARSSIVFFKISIELDPGFVSANFLHLTLSESFFCAQRHFIGKAQHNGY